MITSKAPMTTALFKLIKVFCTLTGCCYFRQKSGDKYLNAFPTLHLKFTEERKAPWQRVARLSMEFHEPTLVEKGESVAPSASGLRLSLSPTV